jgi:hypothetical protein
MFVSAFCATTLVSRPAIFQHHLRHRHSPPHHHIIIIIIIIIFIVGVISTYSLIVLDPEKRSRARGFTLPSLLTVSAMPSADSLQILDNINVFFYLSWLSVLICLPVLVVVEAPKVCRRSTRPSVHMIEAAPRGWLAKARGSGAAFLDLNCAFPVGVAALGSVVAPSD